MKGAEEMKNSSHDSQAKRESESEEQSKEERENMSFRTEFFVPWN